MAIVHKGVPTAYAQTVMGHASGTITFDVYGSGVPVETIAEMLERFLKPYETCRISCRQPFRSVACYRFVLDEGVNIKRVWSADWAT